MNGGDGIDNLQGSAGDDNISGDAGADTIDGGDGADKLNGGVGDDTLIGGAANDTMNGGDGIDNLQGSAGDDNISGDAGADTIDGGDGADTLNGGVGDDTLIGGAANDTMNGGDGIDNLQGNAGRDNLFGESGTDSLQGGADDDLLIGGTEIDMLDGGSGLNICDYTDSEARTVTCRYDDSPPALEGLRVIPSLIDSTSSSTRIRIGLSFLDETGLQTATVTCSRNAGGITYVVVSVEFTPTGAKDKGAGFDNAQLSGFTIEGDLRRGAVSADYDILKGAFPGIFTCRVNMVDILKHETYIESTTTVDVNRTGTGWDDRAPIPTLVRFNPSTIDTSPGANVSTLQLRIEDQTEINWGYFTCEAEGRRVVEMVYYRDGLYNYRTGVRTSPTRSSPTLLEFDAPIEIPTTQAPGVYSCYSSGWDTLRHAETVSAVGSLTVTDSLSSVDLSPPSLASASVNLASVEVGRDSALVMLSFHLTDRSPLGWSYVSCSYFDGTNHRILDAGFEPRRFYDYANGWVAGVSFSGSDSDMEFNVPLRIPKGTYPGKYDCGMAARDSLGNSKSYFLPSVTVVRTPDGMPSAPRNLNFAAGSPTSGILSWVSPSSLGSPELYGYVPQVSTDGVKWSNLPSQTTFSLSIQSLVADTEYWFRVRGENGGTIGQDTTYMSLSWSDVLRIRTPKATVPDVPTALSAASVASSSAALSWTAPVYSGGSAITDFAVEMSRDGGSTWAVVPHVASTSVNLALSGLAPGTRYEVRVAAINGVGRSDYMVGSFTTTAVAASAPRTVTASAVTPSSLTLSWLIPLSNGGVSITDYKVEVSSNGGVAWTSIPHTASNSLSFNVTGLNRATSYRFRVSATNSFGAGALSDVVTVSTLAEVPAAPGAVSVSNVTSSNAVLAWTVPVNNGGSALTDYKVETSRDGVTWTMVPHVASTLLGLTLSGLAPGTQYEVRVSAINVIGAGAYSTITLTTLATAASAPLAVTASAVTSSSLTLSWLIPLSNGGASITDYKVEVSSNGGVAWTSIPHTASNSLSFNVTGLNRATSYRFRVSAVTSFGAGALSSVRTQSTLAVVPSAPGAVSVSNVTSSSAVLAWTVPADNGGSALTNYKVETSRDGGTTWVTVPRTVSTLLGLTLSGLAPGTQYEVRVSAINVIGAGPVSTTTLTTLATSASAPRTVTASAVTSSTLTLSWLIPLSNGGASITDYMVEVSSNGGVTWTSIPHTASNSLSFNVMGLNRATSYRFRVSAVTSFGAGALSNVWTALTKR
jgi:hypothetical protein